MPQSFPANTITQVSTCQVCSCKLSNADIVNRCPSLLQAYSEAINLLNYSTVVIPVTRADKTIDRAMPGYTPLNEIDELNWNACMLYWDVLYSTISVTVS